MSIKTASASIGVGSISLVLLWQIWSNIDTRAEINMESIATNKAKIESIHDDVKDIKSMQQEMRADIKAILLKEK